MSKFYFLLRCPNCGHNMRYHTSTSVLSDKRKSCVYCGKSYKIRDHVLKQS